MTSSTSGGGNKVVDFSKPEVAPEERARRLKVEVDRLASLPVVEWMYYVHDDGVAEKHGVSRAAMRAMIEATVKANEKKAREDKAEDRQREQRVEKQRASTQREQERQQRAQECEQQRADREARERQRERDRELAALSRLPRAEHEPRLAALAERLDEDLQFLRDEFAQFVSVEEASSAAGDIEPWPEPVSTVTILAEVMTQVRRYNVLHDDAAAVAIVLFVLFAWVHDEIAVHSPLLLLNTAEADSGKTALCGTLKFLTPRAYSSAELTGPSLYRFVDHVHPTLFIDEAGNLLKRKPD
jgi:hypothetical protein